MLFYDYTLMANGEIRSHRTHDSSQLVRAVVDIFAEMLPRPVVISIPLGYSPDLAIIADMETCLAAAYFES